MANKPSLVEYITVGCLCLIPLMGLIVPVAVAVGVVILIWKVW